MGMRLILEVEVGYPDLSMHKHVDMLRYLFKKADVKRVNIIDGLSREDIESLLNSTLIQVIPDPYEEKDETEGSVQT